MSFDSSWPRSVWGDLSLPRLVLLHGFLGSSQDWGSLARHLCQDFCVIALDLPGHGEHHLEERAWSMEAMADGLARQLEALGPVRAVVGYSLGGRVSLAAALDSPGLSRSWWWESASPGLEGAAQRQARADLDTARAQQIVEAFPAFLERWYRAPLFDSLRGVPEPVWRAMWARRASNRVHDVSRVIEALSPGRSPSQWGRLETLRGVDHAWLCGALDRKYCAQLERAGQISGGRVCVLPGVGHNVHVEAPRRMAQVLRQAFKSGGRFHNIT